MKKVLLISIIPFLLFISIIVLYFIKLGELESVQKRINNNEKELQSLSKDLKIEQLFIEDYTIASDEWEQWIIRGKKQINYWNDFLDNESNIVITHKSRSSSAINTEINKLLSYLNRTYESKNAKFGKHDTVETTFFKIQSEKPPRFGFGFSSYDGFWPSFSKEEANTLYIQSKIIKEISRFLLDSFDDNENLRLISLKRENAGSEDQKHIGEDQTTGNSLVPYLRDGKNVRSFIFEISFVGKTKNCRSFINQIRSPFSVRSIQVKRKSDQILNSEYNDPSEGTTEPQEDILPIVRDISSIFTIDIEYIFEASINFSDFLIADIDSESDKKRVEELLSPLN